MTKERLWNFRILNREYKQLSALQERIEKDAIRCKAAGVVADSASTLSAEYAAFLGRYYDEYAEIEKCLEVLSPNERAVIRAYYLDGMTFSEISATLAFSLRWLSRLHKSAVSKLENAEKAHSDE